MALKDDPLFAKLFCIVKAFSLYSLRFWPYFCWGGEMADTLALGASALIGMEVQVLSPAPLKIT